MTMAFGVLAAALVVLAPRAHRVHWAASCCAAALHPMFGLSLFASWLAIHRSGLANTERADTAGEVDEQVLVVELVAMGLSAGVPFEDAVEESARHVSDVTANRLRACLRRSRFNHASTEPSDPIARMFAIVSESQDSGASAFQQLTAVVEQVRSDREAALDQRLERLPVAMLFPLALLILPGFLLVAVVPAVIGGISRLGI